MEVKYFFIAICIGLVCLGGYSAVEKLADSRKPADVLIYEKCMDKASFGNPTEEFRKSSTERCAVILESYAERNVKKQGPL